MAIIGERHQPRDSEMSEGLLRQRRNLILVSVFHLLFEFGDIKFQKVGILGTDLLVGRPETLLAFAWALWAYFLLRYWLYYRTERLQRPITASVHTDFQGNLARWAKATQETPDNPIPITNHPFWLIERSDDGRQMLLRLNTSAANGKRVELWSCPIPRSRLYVAKLQAVAFVATRGTEITDYWLPFALAASAPIVSFVLWLQA